MHVFAKAPLVTNIGHMVGASSRSMSENLGEGWEMEPG
jgi:hypothetical protein